MNSPRTLPTPEEAKAAHKALADWIKRSPKLRDLKATKPQQPVRQPSTQTTLGI